MRRWAIGAVVVVAVGVCASQYALWRQNKRTQILLGYLTQAAATANANRVDCRAAGARSTVCNTLSADDVRAILREERGTVPQPAPTVTAESTTPSPAIDPVAFTRAHDVVDRALATGAWGRTEATEFRALLPRLTNEQWTDLMKQLLPAVNAQRIKVSVVGPLF